MARHSHSRTTAACPSSLRSLRSRNVANDLRYLQCVQLTHHYAGNASILAQQRTTAIARLDRSCNLNVASVVPDPARAEIVPVVTMGSELKSPFNGKPIATTASPIRGPFPPRTRAAKIGFSTLCRVRGRTAIHRKPSDLPPRDNRTFAQSATTCALVTICPSVLTKNSEPDEETFGLDA